MTYDRFIVRQQRLTIDAGLPALYKLTYSAAAYNDSLYQRYNIAKPDEFPQFSPRRRAQFLAGRITAGIGLRSLGCHDAQINRGQYRQPIWPPGYDGSLSHQDETVIVAVREAADDAYGLNLGIDIQGEIDESEAATIAPLILTDADKALLDRTELNLNNTLNLSLVFSAKESFFKAAFAAVGRYFDFDAISLQRIDAEKQRLVVKTNIPLSKLPTGFEAQISYRFFEEKRCEVITVCN